MNTTFNLLLISGTLFSLNAATAIVKEDANVRSKPSINSKIIKVLKVNETIEVIQKVNPGDWPWYKTPNGYVSYELLRLQGNKTTQVPKDSKVINTDKEKQFKRSDNDNPSDVIDTDWIKKLHIAIKQPQQEEERKSPKIEDNTQKSFSNTQQEILQEEKKVVVIQKPIIHQKKETVQQPKEKIFTKYFLGVSLHYNTLSVTQKDTVGVIILNQEPDNTATSVGLHAGTKINNYVISANYEILNLDDVQVQSTYLSLDYQFKTIFNPYIGLSLGMSNLEWQIDPLTNSTTRDSKLSSLIYGLQAGVEYTISSHWNIYADIAYQKFNFTTNLISNPALAEIKHEDKKSIGIGVKYWF